MDCGAGTIELEQLSKRYGRRVGVDKLDLFVPEKTMLGFLGPNGAGKTTTIRVLLGLIKPSDGRARLFARDCWRDSRRIKAQVGYLPGDLRLYPWLTGRTALRIFGRARGCDLSAAGRELAEDFGLDCDIRVQTMSRGMRQKLGLILALAHRPRLLILDEPTTALDPLMQEKLCQHLRALAAQGHTVFFSSHSLSEVEQLCDRVAILREGKLVADETLAAMRARAERMVTIRWRTSAQSQAQPVPGFLRVHERGDRDWQATLAGPVHDLLCWIAPLVVEDFSIGQPDLTRLFQRYYA